MLEAISTKVSSVEGSCPKALPKSSKSAAFAGLVSLENVLHLGTILHTRNRNGKMKLWKLQLMQADVIANTCTTIFIIQMNFNIYGHKCSIQVLEWHVYHTNYLIPATTPAGITLEVSI